MNALKHCLIASVIVVSSAAQAAWPERAVALVVPFGGGGITDVVARLTAQRLQKRLQAEFS